MTGEAAAGRRTGRLEELYARHAPGAARLAFLLTGERELAEDVVHDAFVRLAGRFAGLRNPDAFEVYLRRTVVNLCRGQWRRRRTERAYLRREGAAAAGARSWQPDVAARDEMLRALQALPERQRAAVVLRFYEDLSERQTAEVLGCAVGTVKSLVSRAMATLRHELEGASR